MTDSLPRRVAGEIRAELGRQGKSQAWLARSLGKSDMWVSRRLADGTSLEVADLERISAVLNVPAAVFLHAPERAA